MKSLRILKARKITQMEFPLYGGMSLEEAGTFARQIKEHGIQYLSVHLPKDFFEPGYPYSRAHMIEILHILKPELLVIHPALHPELKELMQELEQGLRRQGALPTLTLENVPYYPLNLLLAISKQSGWGITVDFQHSCNQGLPIGDPFSPYVSALSNVHIRDYAPLNPRAYIPPGEGSIPFAFVFEKLAGYGYEGPLFLECPMESGEQFDAALSYLQKELVSLSI